MPPIGLSETVPRNFTAVFIPVPTPGVQVSGRTRDLVRDALQHDLPYLHYFL